MATKVFLAPIASQKHQFELSLNKKSELEYSSFEIIQKDKNKKQFFKS